jgi:hypothetical protein
LDIDGEVKGAISQFKKDKVIALIMIKENLKKLLGVD